MILKKLNGDKEYLIEIWRYRDKITNEIKHYEYKIPRIGYPKIVYQIDKNTNLEIRKFNSFQEASTVTGVRKDTISKWVRGVVEVKYLNFYFSYDPPTTKA